MFPGAPWVATALNLKLLELIYWVIYQTLFANRILQAQRAARVIMPALFAAGQTRHVSDRPTASRQDIRTTDY